MTDDTVDKARDQMSLTEGEPMIPITERCEYLAKGFCGASVDGWCIGGTEDGRCHG